MIKNDDQSSIFGQHMGLMNYFERVWKSTPILVKKDRYDN